MHAGGETGGGLAGAEQRGGAVQQGQVREVEDEGQLDRVGGAELPVQGLGTPGELVGVGGGSGVGGMRAGQRPASRAEQRVAHDGGAQLAGGRPGACPAVGAEESCGIDASPRLRALISRARGLLAGPEDAEPHFRTALADPVLEHWPFERAQTLLDLAEWLRRRRRIAEARAPLNEALETFRRLGARPWIERARAESRAAGLDVAVTAPDALAELSPQQQQIVRLAARGLTNREIGENLFLSPRTVGSHLYRSFPKLGVTARSQLRDLIKGALTPAVRQE